MSGGLWALDAPLLLASTSPTRRRLLDAVGVPVESEAPDVDERALEAAFGGLPAPGLAARLAEAKALAVSGRRPGRLVLGGDQVLEIEGERLHRPTDRTAAGVQVRRLSGRTHELHSAAALARDGALVATVTGAARLTLRPLPEAAVERYLDLAGEAACASVGAYQAEGLGAHLMEQVEGEHATVLGLPLLALLAALRRLGAVAL